MMVKSLATVRPYARLGSDSMMNARAKPAKIMASKKRKTIES